MLQDPQMVIRSLIKAEFTHHHDETRPMATMPTVTISRASGSMGDDIAAELAKRLGVECYDKEIVAKISKHSIVDSKLTDLLDEKVSLHRTPWLVSIITGQEEERESYVRLLVNFSLGVSKVGGVILGRGVHLLLKESRVLRVRITGTPETCAHRLQKNLGLSFKQALAKASKENKKKEQFIHGLFGCKLEDPTNFDLTINTDRLQSYEDGAILILEAIKAWQHKNEQK